MFRFIVISFVAVGCLGSAADAKDIVIQMKNRGRDGMMVFEPSFVKASPGDRVIFKPIDLGHNAEPIPALTPLGVSILKGAINKEVVLTVSVSGLYGVKCMPHYAMGMIALVQVGKVDVAAINAAKAANLPPFAAKRMRAALALVK